MTLNERWLPVPGFEGAYEVSSWGRVRSLDRIVTTATGKRRYRGRVLAPGASPSGHLNVILGGAKNLWVHRLVLEAFVGPCPEGMEACHNNGNPADNTLGNLRWGTHAENVLDSVRHGTHPQAAKTQCPRGHKLSSPNLVLAAMKRGWRNCLACQKAHDYIYHHPSRKHDLQRISNSYYRSIMAQQAADDYHLDADSAQYALFAI